MINSRGILFSFSLILNTSVYANYTYTLPLNVLPEQAAPMEAENSSENSLFSEKILFDNKLAFAKFARVGGNQFRGADDLKTLAALESIVRIASQDTGIAIPTKETDKNCWFMLRHGWGPGSPLRNMLASAASYAESQMGDPPSFLQSPETNYLKDIESEYERLNKACVDESEHSSENIKLTVALKSLVAFYMKERGAHVFEIAKIKENELIKTEEERINTEQAVKKAQDESRKNELKRRRARVSG